MLLHISYDIVCLYSYRQLNDKDGNFCSEQECCQRVPPQGVVLRNLQRVITKRSQEYRSSSFAKHVSGGVASDGPSRRLVWQYVYVCVCMHACELVCRQGCNMSVRTQVGTHMRIYICVYLSLAYCLLAYSSSWPSRWEEGKGKGLRVGPGSSRAARPTSDWFLREDRGPVKSLAAHRTATSNEKGNR